MIKKYILIIIIFSVFLTSCGTILKPQQRNKPNNGRIDTTILALDVLGLLLVFPGIIALSIDTFNATIFLPLKAS